MVTMVRLVDWQMGVCCVIACSSINVAEQELVKLTHVVAIVTWSLL